MTDKSCLLLHGIADEYINIKKVCDSNYLLFMMSLMQSGRGEVCYEAPGTECLYYGAQTNIPASEYIVDQLSAQQSKLKKIVILCSHEVLHNEILPPGVSAHNDL